MEGTPRNRRSSASEAIPHQLHGTKKGTGCAARGLLLQAAAPFSRSMTATFSRNLSYVKAGAAAGCILRGPGRRNYTLRLIVTWGAAGS
jgi:hypothetical protein